MEFKEYNTINSQINRLYYSNEVGNKSRFWHYTSLGAVLSMFMDYHKNVNAKDIYAKKCTVYASNARYMNDPDEFLDGINWYRKLSNSKDPISFNYSLISFSHKGDNLDHWKYYGKDVGVSLCFDMEKIETSVFKKSSSGDIVYDKNNRPLKVYYKTKGKEGKKSYFKKLKKRMDDGILEPEYLSALFIPFCKDEAYIDEAEYRMVFFDTVDTEFVYNTGNPQKIKPATKVKIRLREEADSDQLLVGLNVYKPDPNDNIISHIVVGPGDTQELVFNTLIHVFDRCRYNYIDVPQRTNNIDKEAIDESYLDYGESGWITCEDDKKIRYGYRCHNGIVIMISSISFRA